MSKQRDLYLKLLWNEVKGMSISKAGASDMVIFQPPPRMDRTSAEFTRLAQQGDTFSTSSMLWFDY